MKPGWSDGASVICELAGAIRESLLTVARRQLPALGTCALAFVSCQAEDRMPPRGTTSASGFVQEFYDWYVPVQGSAPWSAALTRAQVEVALAPALLDALKEDADAQARDTTGYIVGIDYDPFLSSQDPCERYAVTGEVQAGDTYRVAVKGSGRCAVHSEADVFVEVAQAGGGWVVVNFWYPGPPDWDLLSNLRRLREDRASPGSNVGGAPITGEAGA